MTVTINKDQTVSSHNPGPAGSGSMTLLSEQRGVDLVNQLSVLEMICAYMLARNGKTAFPLGQGPELYALLLGKAEAWVLARAAASLAGEALPKGPIDEELYAEIERHSVGYWRQFMVHDIGSSFNGPLDSYLEVACDHKRKGSVMQGLEGEVETTGRGY
jgi:hypothetical protein